MKKKSKSYVNFFPVNSKSNVQLRTRRISTHVSNMK
jgi:hypothetical protein